MRPCGASSTLSPEGLIQKNKLVITLGAMSDLYYLISGESLEERYFLQNSSSSTFCSQRTYSFPPQSSSKRISHCLYFYPSC